ncbi:hypothetical protein HK096_005365 [Nowakowskiella sp. JEL0078]|nr:hypothetical protein HK096_005365 [Nowakowskiella sp. JEL0078]
MASDRKAWESNPYFKGTSAVIASSASYVTSPLMEAQKESQFAANSQQPIHGLREQSSSNKLFVKTDIPQDTGTPSTVVQNTAIDTPGSSSTIGCDPEKDEFLFYSNPNSIKSPSTVTNEIGIKILSEKNEKQGKSLKHVEMEESILATPVTRKKLAEKKAHRPIFMWTILVLNYIRTGIPIQIGDNFNYMIGPSPGVMITMGARFTPCIRPGSFLDTTTENIACYTGSVGSKTIDGTAICTLADTCGFSRKPDQWYRFITPIFLHGGVLHLASNMLFQMKTGVQMERDWGWWRVAGIYFSSGVAGFLFGGNYSGLSPSVGCSGSLYGRSISRYQNTLINRIHP